MSTQNPELKLTKPEGSPQWHQKQIVLGSNNQHIQSLRRDQAEPHNAECELGEWLNTDFSRLLGTCYQLPYAPIKTCMTTQTGETLVHLPRVPKGGAYKGITSVG